MKKNITKQYLTQSKWKQIDSNLFKKRCIIVDYNNNINPQVSIDTLGGLIPCNIKNKIDLQRLVCVTTCPKFWCTSKLSDEDILKIGFIKRSSIEFTKGFLTVRQINENFTSVSINASRYWSGFGFSGCCTIKELRFLCRLGFGSPLFSAKYRLIKTKASVVESINYENKEDTQLQIF